MEHIYDMIIIGGGPGGYTAALYAARAGLSALVLERFAPGGQMALTSQIDNYPGFPQGVDGFTLGQDMRAAAERFGAKTVMAEVKKLDLKANPKVAETAKGVFYGKTVAFATGANPRKLGISGEKELTGLGVSYCAHCDGMFYRGKTVAVVGGGNSAVADALILSRIAQKVYIIHRRDSLRATKIYYEPLRKAENVEFVWNSAVSALHSDETLSAVTVRDLQSGREREIRLDGLFVSIGREPATELVAGQLALDEAGYIAAGEDTVTSIPGVYAVGDVRSKALRQVVTAVADGAMAAQMAEEFLLKSAENAL